MDEFECNINNIEFARDRTYEYMCYNRNKHTHDLKFLNYISV